jgi:hypothetical protein
VPNDTGGFALANRLDDDRVAEFIRQKPIRKGSPVKVPYRSVSISGPSRRAQPMVQRRRPSRLLQ